MYQCLPVKALLLFRSVSASLRFLLTCRSAWLLLRSAFMLQVCPFWQILRIYPDHLKRFPYCLQRSLHEADQGLLNRYDRQVKRNRKEADTERKSSKAFTGRH